MKSPRISEDELSKLLGKGNVRVSGARSVVLAPKQKAGKRSPAKPNKHEELLALHLKLEGLTFERQHRWHRTRMFRADFAFVPERLLVEIEGGVHALKTMLEHDIKKSQEAMSEGWRLLRISTSQVKDGTAVGVIRRALKEVECGR